MPKMPTIADLEKMLLMDSVADDIGILSRVLTTPENQNPDKILSAADVRHDTSVLARIFINVWCAWPFLDQIEKRHILNGLMTIHHNATDIRASQYFEMLRPIIEKVPDKHLLLTLRNCNRLRTNGGHPHADVGQNIVGCNNDIPLNWESEDVDVSSIIKTELRHDKIAVLGMRAMCRAAGFEHELQKAKEILPKSDALIIDLRGNFGGSDLYSSAFAAYLCGAKCRSCKKQYIRSTPDARRIQSVFLNGANWDNLNTDTDPTVWHVFPNISANLTAGYAKPIYILIDSHVASSAEIFVLKMAHHPLVKFVGDNTSGCEENGWVCNLFLPHSFIRVRPGQVHRELEYPHFELHGFTPDIPVPDGMDAMDVAIADYYNQNNLIKTKEHTK